MLFHMIDQDSLAIDLMVGQHVQDHSRALVFVLQVRRVNEYRLVVSNRQFHVLLENDCFVAGVFVEPNFSDSEYIRTVEKFWNELEYFTGEFDVFGFFGVDAQPSEMLNAVLGGTFLASVS